MIKKTRIFRCFFVTLSSLLLLVPHVMAGNKKHMSVEAAKVLAERALIESVYGLKLRASEEVIDMIAASFSGKAESKTSSLIKDVKYEDVVYDAEKDIAMVTASVSLPEITNIDGKVLDLKNKVFRRVAFATSTPSMAGSLQAMRAAEIDAYKQLIKRLTGLTLESQTTIENYILTSDVVKTKVLATLYLAEVTDYGWDKDGDAYVKMALNLVEASEILGEKIITADAIATVEGHGAVIDDFKVAKEK